MKKLITETNKHLADEKKRAEGILRSVVASSRIEGIILSKSQQKEIAKRVAEQLKKRGE